MIFFPTHIGSLLVRGWILLEESFLALLLTAMILLACLQIGMRLFFHSGYIWADSLLRHLVIWAGLFGAAAATRQGKHIAIDLASHLLPAAAAGWLQVLLNAAAAVISAFLTRAAVIFVRDEAAFGTGGRLLGMPEWGYYLVLPAAFGLITFYFALNSLLAVIDHHGRRPRPPVPLP